MKDVSEEKWFLFIILKDFFKQKNRKCRNEMHKIHQRRNTSGPKIHEQSLGLLIFKELPLPLGKCIIYI